MYNLTQLRQNEFPLSASEIYFNHASMSPLPQRSASKMRRALQHMMAQPWAFMMEERQGLVDQIKGDAARLISAVSPDEIVPITTTSSAITAFALSIDWQAGDNVLFCEQEFPSNVYPWMRLAEWGVEARPVPAVGGGLTLEQLKPLVDDRTRLVAASAIQFFSGHRTDLAAIGTFCQQNNLRFFVDAIQAVGHMEIDVQAMHIDALATGGQKSLLAAPGIGFMYVQDDFCQTLVPRTSAPNATQEYRHWLAYDLTPLPGAARFSGGTSNFVGLCSLAASLQLLLELGVGHIDAHTSGLAGALMGRLAELGYVVVTPAGAHGPIVTFESGLTGEETDTLVTQLLAEHVTVVKHLNPAGTAHLRASFHCYNTHDEVDRFIDILQRMLPKRVERC